MDKREYATDSSVSDGTRQRVTHSPVRKADGVMTRSQIAKKDVTAEENKNPASPTKTDIMYQMLHDIKFSIEASAASAKNLDNKFIELSRRIDRLEALDNKSGRDEGRSETDQATGKSPEGANDLPSHEVRVGENATVMAKLPRGGWLKNPFEEIKFFGRTDKQNPIRFLSRFERTAEYEGVRESDQLHFFGKCLRGAALTWFDVTEPENIREAREAFVKHFWGEEHQARFREEVYTGRYNAMAGESMSEYALNIIKQAKLLNPPMTDQELVRCIKRHYGNNISREVRPTTVKNVEEFVTLLDEIELERERAKKFEIRKKETANKDKSSAENKKREDSTKKPWIKNNVNASNKFTRNNVKDTAKFKSDDDASDNKKAKDDKNVVYDKTNYAQNKENKNLDTATRVEKTASRKDFPARKNLAAVQASEIVSDSEEESNERNDVPKLASLRIKTKGTKMNKIKRDRVNAEKFARIKIKNTASEMDEIPETAEKLNEEVEQRIMTSKIKSDESSSEIKNKKSRFPSTKKTTVEKTDEIKIDNATEIKKSSAEKIDKIKKIAKSQMNEVRDKKLTKDATGEKENRAFNIETSLKQRKSHLPSTEGRADEKTKWKIIDNATEDKNSSAERIDKNPLKDATENGKNRQSNKETKITSAEKPDRGSARNKEIIKLTTKNGKNRASNKEILLKCAEKSDTKDARNKDKTKTKPTVVESTGGETKTKTDDATQSEEHVATEADKGTEKPVRRSNEHERVEGGKVTEVSGDRKLGTVRVKQIIDDVDELTREDQIKRISIGSAYVDVNINKFSTMALLDTGAQVSAITKELFDKMIDAKIEMRVIPVRKFSLIGAFAEKGQTASNRVQIKFKISDEEFVFEFIIVKSLAYNIILGLDFMKNNYVSIDCDPDNVYIRFRNGKKLIAEICSLSIDDAEGCVEILLADHATLFDGEIGRVNNYKHKIVMNDERPFKKKPYPVPEVHRKKVKEHLRQLEREGIIGRASTQYVSPLVVVVKKSGDIRLCLDAREVNKRMANEHDQPPTIDEVFRRIGSKKYFTTLDVARAFWQIPLTDDSKKYTGFSFDNQTYIFHRLPFGLKTSGSSFTRAMHKTLGSECDAFSIVYLDDILIASNTMEEHVFQINLVLERLKEAGFKLNKDKCEFFKTQIKFLGHTFDEITAEMNNDTKTAIENFAKPNNKKAIQAFLGLVNWDRRFIKNLATLTKPLERLLCKNQKFEWTSVENDAFKNIKNAFRQAPSLYIIKTNLKFGIYVDASKFGIGAKLYQYEDANPEKEYVVAYASRSLKGAELNYTITELECLALVWALRKWHTTLLGRHVRVHTDHRALKFISACADDSSRIARWIAFLNEFNLEIIHIPGKENYVADTLSRRNVNNGYARKENAIKKIAALRKPNDDIDTADWFEIIRDAQTIDDNLISRLENNDDENTYERDGLIRIMGESGERIEIPGEIKWQLVQRVHDYLLHFGTDKVIDFAQRFFKITNLERVARDVVASCETCQATKYYTRPTRGTEYFVLPEKPGQVVSIDIFGPLPQTPRGNKYILVTMDQFSKLTNLYTMKNQKLETIIDALQVEYFGKNGVPSEILSDNGGQFITNRWREFATEMGFAIRKTAPYNPQSNPVERVMRELGRIIRVYAHDRQTSWDKLVPRIEKTINSTAHRSTGCAPLDIHPNVHGFLHIDPRLKPAEYDEDEEEEQQAKMENKIQRTAATLKKRAAQRKKQTDKHGEAEVYEIGDKVWIKIHRRSDASRRLTRKIHRVYDGPYKVRNVIRPNAYTVETEDGDAIGVFNARQIKPHREAKLKPAIQINMIEPREEIKSISSEHAKKFCSDLKTRMKSDTSDKIILTEEEGRPERSKKRPRSEKESDSDGNPEGKSQGNLKKRRRSGVISEKGMRHISRISRLISERKQMSIIDGTVNGQPMEIILDFRGEFNVVTKSALKIIEATQGRLQRLYESKAIPTYLKREKNIQFKAVSLQIEAFSETNTEEAMILPDDVPCILIGRQASKKLGNITKTRDKTEDGYILTRWSKKRSANSMSSIRANLEKSSRKKAESDQPKGTKETEGGPRDTPEREEAIILPEEDEEVTIVREVQKSASKVRENKRNSDDICENSSRQLINELEAIYTAVKKHIAHAASMSDSENPVNNKETASAAKEKVEVLKSTPKDIKTNNKDNKIVACEKISESECESAKKSLGNNKLLNKDTKKKTCVKGNACESKSVDIALKSTESSYKYSNLTASVRESANSTLDKQNRIKDNKEKPYPTSERELEISEITPGNNKQNIFQVDNTPKGIKNNDNKTKNTSKFVENNKSINKRNFLELLELITSTPNEKHAKKETETFRCVIDDEYKIKDISSENNVNKEEIQNNMRKNKLIENNIKRKDELNSIDRYLELEKNLKTDNYIRSLKVKKLLDFKYNIANNKRTKDIYKKILHVIHEKRKIEIVSNSVKGKSVPKCIKRKMYEQTLSDTKLTRKQQMALATGNIEEQSKSQQTAQFRFDSLNNYTENERENFAMTEDKENRDVNSSFQKENEEEDKMYKKATTRACWDALRRLREDRAKIWQDLINDEEDPNIPEDAEFNELWNNEIERSRKMLEALYHNLRITKGTRLFKKTTIIKDKKGQDTLEISSVIMVKRIKPTWNEEIPIEISHRITKDDMTSRYRIEQEDIEEGSDRSTVSEYQNAKEAKLIEKFTIEHDEKKQMKVCEILQPQKTKPKIKNVQIVTKAKGREDKEKKNPEKKRRRESSSPHAEKENENNKKELRRDKSRQSPLAGKMQPEGQPRAASGSPASSRGSSRASTPVRMTTDVIEYRTGPKGEKIPVIRLKRAEADDNDQEEKAGPSWRR